MRYMSRFCEASVRLSSEIFTRRLWRGSPIGIRRSSVAKIEFRGVPEPGGPSKYHMYTGLTSSSESARVELCSKTCGRQDRVRV